MPRQAHLDAPGTLHHVIARGLETRSIVNDVVDRKNFVKRLGELSAETKTIIYTWAGLPLLRLPGEWVFQPRPYQKL